MNQSVVEQTDRIWGTTAISNTTHELSVLSTLIWQIVS